ncbi:MAG TPA: hypothetical protein PLO44_02205 [Candidatus Paceibacterota bacterium]|nr:hypothetical protein [Candidatus Paceibacterota bacterium]
MAFLSSCKTGQLQQPIILTQFSQKLIDDYALTNDQILSLQFFNGPDTIPITLKRRWYDETKSIIDGQLIYSKTEHRDSIIIQPFTKGRGLEYDSIVHLLKISFGADSAYVVFGPADNKEGNFILYSLKGTNPPKTNYGSIRYTITSGAYGASKLFIVFNNEKKPDFKGRVEPGANQQNYNQPVDDQRTTNKPSVPVDTNSVKQPGPNDY